VAKIVICEDDPVIQKLILIALRNSTHDIYMAGDGAEGLHLIRAERPALIITDVEMPGVNGLAVCAAVRSDPELNHIPIIVLSASVQRTQTRRAFEQGATDFLGKPFTVGDLRQKVCQYLG
jgi:CheY-like chemotaxis protein